MLRSGLALWAYTAPTNAYPLVVSEYSEQVEALEFTTVAPGGFGDLACVLKLPDARLPRPELQFFSRLCLRDGFSTCFGGEWSDPALMLDDASGEYVHLSALGGGAGLRDDPADAAYAAATTAQAIVANEFARRAGYLTLDPDQSAVLPTAPASTFTPVYDGYNLEEILHDLTGALGDYVWTVYDHPRNADPAGFPTWQLRVHPRDTATTHYTALSDDILAWRVMPSSQRAYNVVEVAYVDPVAGPGLVTTADTRLNADGSQGNAPFRRRKLRRSLGRLPLTAAQATAIANAWLATYANPTNKVEVELRGVRDANGLPIPLHQVRADCNLFVPELAVRGQSLPAGPSAGVNQFWIAETSYRETASGDAHLTLQLDNYADRAVALLARLQIADEVRQRTRGVYRAVASPGAQQVGYCGIRHPGATAGQRVVPILSNTPTGLSFTTIASANVGSGPTVTAGTLTLYGCEVTVTAAANGDVVWTGKYTTQGA
jgi:hypothetical protein